MVERTRSEYRLTLSAEGPGAKALSDMRAPDDADRTAMAELMLAGYGGTIDDEGETIVEALEAVDFMLEHCERDASFVQLVDGQIAAMSLVVNVEGLEYIDPVVVAAEYKNAGRGRRIVQASLAALVERGVVEVGATITDGNEPSERLFASLGATRVGPWPR